MRVRGVTELNKRINFVFLFLNNLEYAHECAASSNFFTYAVGRNNIDTICDVIYRNNQLVENLLF